MPAKNLNFYSPRNCLCFNARKTARLLTRAYDAALAPAGVTATQFSLLAVLEGAGEMRMSDLSMLVETDRTTLTRNLNILERDGIIERRTGDDARERLVKLTATGRRKLAIAMKHWTSAQQESVESIGTKMAEAFINQSAAIKDIIEPEA